MDMLDAVLGGLALLTPTVLAWIVVSVVLTTIIAILPGIGGLFALVMMLPLVFLLPTEAGLAMLVASIAVNGTGNTMTGILFGVPGSADGVATMIDGLPMARRGEGVRAVTAGLGASAVGGVIGAIALGLMLPVFRPVILALSSPEFLMIILAAIVFLATVTQGSTVRALVAGAFGLLISFVGLEPSTAAERYTFDWLYLWNGLPLVPAVIGLYGICEMLDLLRKGGTVAGTTSSTTSRSQIGQGLRDVFVHWRVTLQSSLSGIVVGLIPGLGGMSAQFIAYSQARKTSRRKHLYGTGIPDGVIAADAATNSNDGGGFVPTLLFGIPGGSAMAIFLVAAIGLGVQPGPEMMTTHLDLVWMFIFILVIANIMATALCIGLVGSIARLTHINILSLAPPILVLSLLGAYATTFDLGDIVVAVLFGFLGMIMKKYDYSRANLVIGLVLGQLVEHHFLLSVRLFGWEFVTRPIALGLLIATVLVLFAPLFGRALHAVTRRPGRGVADPAAVAPGVTADIGARAPEPGRAPDSTRTREDDNDRERE